MHASLPFAARALAGIVALALIVTGCAAGPQEDETAASEEGALILVRPNVPRPPALSPAPTVANACRAGHVPSGILATMPSWSCPRIDVPEREGALVGLDGRDWLAQWVTVLTTNAEIAELAPTLTPAMLSGAQPFCYYEFSSTPGVCTLMADVEYGRRVFDVGAISAGFKCMRTYVCPGAGGCPSCLQPTGTPVRMPPRW